MTSQSSIPKENSSDGQHVDLVEDAPDAKAADTSSNSKHSKLLHSSNAENGSQLSKNRQKKLKRKLDWEEGREARKVKRRAKAKEKRLVKREEHNQLIAQGMKPPQKSARPVQVNVPVTIIMDCDFEDLMSEGELISLASQLTRSYSDVRKSIYRPHLAFSSFKGALKDRFDGILTRAHEHWTGVTFSDECFDKVADDAIRKMTSDSQYRVAGPLSHVSRTDIESTDVNNRSDEGTIHVGMPAESQGTRAGEVIYLSSDSDTTLTTLKPNGVYVIGGLVDKNRHKGICHERAVSKNIKTAKLPIGKYLKMQSRQVLTTNQVNEIMVKWLEVGDWAQAFLQAIPKRKGGMLNDQETGPENRGAGLAADQVEEEANGERDRTVSDRGALED